MIEKSRLERKVLAMAFVLLMVSAGLILFVNTNANAQEVTKQQEKNYLRVAMQSDMAGPNIFATNDVWSSNVQWRMYESTLTWDLSMRVKPWVAINWSFSADYKHWTVHYRTGSAADALGGPMLFHDGTEVTVDDIQFYYEYIRDIGRWSVSVECLNWTPDPEHPGHYIGVRVLDDHTIEFNCNITYANFATDTLSAIILPKHIWGQHWTDKLTWMAPLGDPDELVGSGPFKWNTWMSGTYVQLDRFDNYFDWTTTPDVDENGQTIPGSKAFKKENGEPFTSADRLPMIDGVKYIIKRTTDLAVMALKNNEVDFVAWSLPPSFLPELSVNPDIGIYVNPEPGFFYLAYNMRMPAFGYANYQGGDYSDPGKTFRKAVAHLIDKETVVKVALQGYGEVAKGPLNAKTSGPWYNSALPTYTYSIEEARAILDADPNYNKWVGGWRKLPGIGTATIEILTPEAGYDPIRSVMGEMIASSMRAVGINAERKSMAFLEIVQRINQRNFWIYILGWRIGSAAPPDFLYDFYESSQAATGNNYCGFHNADYDKLMEWYRANGTYADRLDLVWRAQQLLADERPNDWCYFRTNIEVTRKDRFTGWVPFPAGIFNGWSLQLIHTPSKPLYLSYPGTYSAMQSNGTTRIQTRVTSFSGTTEIPVSGAKVNLSISNGPDYDEDGKPYGHESEAALSEASGYRPDKIDPMGGYIIGVTDANGYFRATLKAPWVAYSLENATNGMKVLLSFVATKEGYDKPPPKVFLMTVYPEGISFLKSTMSASYSLILPPKATTTITVTVLDEKDVPIEGAYVTVKATPPSTKYSLQPNGGYTNSLGEFTTTFTYTPEMTADTETITITANATMSGKVPSGSSITLTAIKTSSPSSTSIWSWLQDNPIALGGIVGIIVAIAIVAIVYKVQVGKKRRIKRLKGGEQNFK